MNFQYILIISLFFTGLNSLAAAAAEQRLVTRRNSCPLLSGSLSAAAQSDEVKEDQSDWPTQNYRRSRFTAYLQEDMEKHFNELQGNSPLLLPDVRGINSRQQLEQQAKKIQGFRSSKISADLAEEAINSAPKKVRKIVANIKRGVFENHEKNVVLYGFPGTGKTTLAKAVAQACDIPCLLIAAGRLSTEYANSGSVHLREMFKLAKEYGQPCIIAIDELEVLIKKQNEKHGHENSILTTLWQEMDAVQDRENKIVVIFTLNSKKDLPAPMEDRLTEVVVRLPTLKQRERALAYHLKERQVTRGLRYENGVTAINIARKTHDFSQRELEKLLLNATRRGLKKGCLVTNKDFLIAIKEIVNNPARKEAREAGTLRF